LRAGLIFSLSRAPVNFRPLLGIKKKRNPKGLALFVKAYLNLYALHKEDRYLRKAKELLESLLRLSRSDKYSGHCWGYDHPWQNSQFFIPPYEPNCVVTCFVADAFFDAYLATGDVEFFNVSRSAADFITRDLNQIYVGDGMACISYDLHSEWKVINVNAMASALLARLSGFGGGPELETLSKSTMRWVVSKKTDYHAWYYTDPPEASRITHDNYHTGFVLDAIQTYCNVFPDDEIKTAWLNGLEYYKENLFADDYAPKWMHNRTWPNDIHGAAQGIITFSGAAVENPDYINFAKNIIVWTLNHLYSKTENRFYYQKGPYWTKKYTLMRWCQAWMLYSISVHLTAKSHSIRQ
jgi:hypothetical protein